MKSIALVLMFMLLSNGSQAGSSIRLPDRKPVGGTHSKEIEYEFSNPRDSHVSSSLDDMVLSTDFESTVSGSLPADWSRLDQDGGFSGFFNRRSSWLVYEYGSQNAHSGTKVVMCHFNDPPIANNDYLILPQQYLSGTITLSYWVASQDPDYLESYEVRVSTAEPIPARFTSLIHSAANVPAAWTLQTLDLSAFAGQPFWIAFRHTSYDRFMLKLDDLTLEGTVLPTGAISGIIINDVRRSSGTASALVLIRGRFLRTAIAGSNGRFVLGGLPAGTYDLEFRHFQYEPVYATGVLVTVPDTTVRDAYVTSARGSTLLSVSAATPQAIRDFDTTRMNIDVDTALVIDHLSVGINLNHTYIGDLQIWLRGSYGDVVQLMKRDPLMSGDNIVNCNFEDEAPRSYGSGVPPFTGLWRSEEPLSLFRGAKTIGRWTLLVYDGGGGDQGTLFSYSMFATVSREPVSAPPIADIVTLESNYPNPFNATTRLRFSLTSSGIVRLTIHSLQGQLVAEVVHDWYEAGNHEVLFNGAGLSSGVYVAAVHAGGEISTRKMLLLK